MGGIEHQHTVSHYLACNVAGKYTEKILKTSIQNVHIFGMKSNLQIFHFNPTFHIKR